ncbi:uncharacterized protein LOC142644123 [Castanea sativa]|uniref:uncharacterized protein LOC142644123 n=1 Tax=Castanea sativa TaxID=21020 RepID=UPI003F64952A
MAHMSMVAIAYMSNHNDLDHTDVVDLLATGFSGTLRGWWDSHLTKESRESIKHAVKRDNDGMPIFDEIINRGILDGVNTLVYTILKHFVGTPSNVSSRLSDYLNNLRCPTMSDYRWYQDVFISRVMLWKDSTKPYWKERDQVKINALIVANLVISAKTATKSLIEKNMDKHQSDNDEREDGDESTQQAPPSGNVSGNALIKLIDNQLALVKHMMRPKRFTKVKIVVSHDYAFNTIVMIDFGVDVNCIQEGLIPSKYYEKSIERLIPSVLVENMTDKVILGLPFIATMKKHIVDLPYDKDFSEKDIPTKARPIQMNAETVEFCKNEINDLLKKKLIRNSKSPWSCTAFYVQKNWVL